MPLWGTCSPPGAARPAHAADKRSSAILGAGAESLQLMRQSSAPTNMDAPVSPGTLHGRRSLNVVFGLFLASGVTVGAYCLWAVADWIHSQGEGAFGLFYLGAISFVPTLLAWLAGGVHMFMASRNRDVRLGVALTTAHLV